MCSFKVIFSFDKRLYFDEKFSAFEFLLKHEREGMLCFPI